MSKRVKRTKTVYVVIEDTDWDADRVIAVYATKGLAEAMISNSKRNVHYVEVGYFKGVDTDE